MIASRINNKPVRLDFSYDFASGSRKTICTIYGIKDGKTDLNDVIAVGMATRAKDDPDVKEMGRKIALARAIEFIDIDNRKDVSKQIWSDYLGRSAKDKSDREGK